MTKAYGARKKPIAQRKAEKKQKTDLKPENIVFNRFWSRQFLKHEVNLLHPYTQGLMHEIAKAAFRLGIQTERKLNEPVQLGGWD